jgi:hypothetical protein
MLAALLILIQGMSGVSLRENLSISLVLAINSVSAGYVWKSWIRRDVTIAETVGVGLAMTFLVVILAGLLTPQGVPSIIEWLILPTIAILLMWKKPGRPSAPTRIIAAWPSVLSIFLWTIVSSAVSRYQWTRYDLNQPVDFAAYHPDNLFHQSVATATANWGSGQLGLLSDWPIRYHWFSHAWVGSLEDVVQAEAFVVLTRTLPFVSIIAITALASAWAGRLTNRRWAPVAAAGLVVVGRFVADDTAVEVNWDSASQTSSTVLLLLACFIVVAPRKSQLRLGDALLIGVVAFTLAGMKLSAAFVLVAALWFSAISAAVWAKKSFIPMLIAASSATVAVATCFFLFLAGQADGGGLRIRQAWDFGSLQSVLFTTLALLPGWAGLLYLVLRRQRRWTPSLALALGAGLGGLFPLWVFQEARPNNTWFITSATAVVWIVSVAGAAIAVTDFGVFTRAKTWPIPLIALIVSLISILTWAILARAVNVEPGVSQLLFIAVSTVIALGVSIITIRRPVAVLMSFFICLFVVSLTFSPVTQNVSERFFPNPQASDSISKLASLPDEQVGEGSQGRAIDSDTVAELTLILERETRIGEVVAFADARLSPLLIAEKLLLYVTAGSYIGLGDMSTKQEFQRRTNLLKSLETNPSESVRVLLCADDVSFVILDSNFGQVSRPDWLDSVGEVAGFHIARLRCS